MFIEDYTHSVKNMRNRTVRLEHEGDYWTDDEKAAVDSMFHQGVGITEMALILQRTEPAICQQIEKMDLYGRKTAPSRRKSAPKPPSCLCSVCKLDSSFCPRFEACRAAQEDA